MSIIKFQTSHKEVLVDIAERWIAELRDSEYDIAAENSKKFWENNKPPAGEYGFGLLNTKDDPHRVERIGKSTELLFSGIFDVPATIAENVRSTPHDFLIDKVVIEVTTCFSMNPYKKIRRVGNGTGNIRETKFDFIVVAKILEEDRDKKFIKISFEGWITKTEFDALLPYRQEGRKTGEVWHNRDIYLNTLHKMKELKPAVDALNKKRNENV